MSTGRSSVTTDFLQQLRDRVDLVPLISSYIPVSRKGRNYWACCPFHHEKTPSFCIYDEEQTFHCYGCGVTGDVITFAMKIENLDFIDALKHLADKAGLQMPEFHGDNNVAELKKKKDRFLSLLKDANEHYQSNLVKSQKAIEYVRKRELTNKEVEEFGIGYSFGWYDLVDYLHTKGYKDEDMLEIGIVKKNENGKLYDFFAFRLMFPLLNKFGDCVGFSGRDLDGTSPAKYKNSSQSIVFDKSSTIFAFNKVKKLSVTQKIEYVVLCEGQMDVIAMHEAGFTTAMACLGTALTEVNAKEISRISNKVVLCLDGDIAGINATLKAIKILRNQNLDISVACLEGGKDPDEVIKNCGIEKMQDIINKAVDSIEFEIRELASHYDLNDIANKTKFLSGAFKILEIFKTISEKEVYVNLISKLSGVSSYVIRSDINKFTENQTMQEEKIEDENSASIDALVKAQEFVLASLVYGKEYAQVDSDLDGCFENANMQKLYNFIKLKKEYNEKINIASILDLFDDELDDVINDVIAYNLDSYGEDATKHYEICKNKIKMRQLDKMLTSLLHNLKDEKDAQKQIEISKQINSIITRKNNLNKSGGINV